MLQGIDEKESACAGCQTSIVQILFKHNPIFGAVSTLK